MIKIWVTDDPIFFYLSACFRDDPLENGCFDRVGNMSHLEEHEKIIEKFS